MPGNPQNSHFQIESARLHFCDLIIMIMLNVARYERGLRYNLVSIIICAQHHASIGQLLFPPGDLKILLGHPGKDGIA